MKQYIKLVILTAVLAVFFVLAYLLAEQKFDDKFASSFGGLAAGAGVIFAAVTLRQMKEANDFSVITAFHARLNDPPSYKSRGYLFNKFGQDIAQVAQSIFGSDSISSGQVNINWILENVDNDAEKEKELNLKLSEITFGADGMSALEAVERVLLDFDLIALPFCEGNESAKVAAYAWKPVLKKTSESILPFIAIKTRLRNPESYKYHYLKLINDLKDINLKGLSVPKSP